MSSNVDLSVLFQEETKKPENMSRILTDVYFNKTMKTLTSSGIVVNSEVVVGVIKQLCSRISELEGMLLSKTLQEPLKVLIPSDSEIKLIEMGSEHE